MIVQHRALQEYSSRAQAAVGSLAATSAMPPLFNQLADHRPSHCAGA